MYTDSKSVCLQFNLLLLEKNINVIVSLFQVDEWSKKIRQEMRGIDRQIRGKK